MIKNFSQVMKQAKAMQEKMEHFQQEMEKKEYTGASGAGLVKIIINGKNAMRRIEIDPALMIPSEKDVLEDLIVAAFNDAREKCQKDSDTQMGSLTGGLDLKLPFM